MFSAGPAVALDGPDSRHRPSASATTWLRARTRQPMTNSWASQLSNRLSRHDCWTQFRSRPVAHASCL